MQRDSNDSMIPLRLIAAALLYSLVAVFLQGAFFAYILPEGFIPNLLIIFVMFLAFYEVSVSGAILTFIVGIIYDLSGGTLIGPWAGSFVAVYFAFAILSRHLFIDSPLSAAVAALAASFGSNLVYWMLAVDSQNSATRTIGLLLSEGFVTALCAPILFVLLKRITDITQKAT